ncbi:NAD-dependent epimerase/dehydratase family protein [Paenibacillus rhizoplanae]
MTKALVTGATGFLGRHTARRLARMGWEVYAQGRNPGAGKAAGAGRCSVPVRGSA